MACIISSILLSTISSKPFWSTYYARSHVVPKEIQRSPDYRAIFEIMDRDSSILPGFPLPDSEDYKQNSKANK